MKRNAAGELHKKQVLNKDMFQVSRVGWFCEGYSKAICFWPQIIFVSWLLSLDWLLFTCVRHAIARSARHPLLVIGGANGGLGPWPLQHADDSHEGPGKNHFPELVSLTEPIILGPTRRAEHCNCACFGTEHTQHTYAVTTHKIHYLAAEFNSFHWKRHSAVHDPCNHVWIRCNLLRYTLNASPDPRQKQNGPTLLWPAAPQVTAWGSKTQYMGVSQNRWPQKMVGWLR